MIIPAKKLLVVTLRDREEEVLRTLGELAVVQLRKPEERKILEAEAGRLKELEEIYQKFISIWSSLSIHEEEGQEAYKRYNSLRIRLNSLEREKLELRRAKLVVEALLSLGERILPESKKFEEIFSIIGFLDRRDLHELREGLSGKPMILETAKVSGSDYLIYLIGTIDLWEDVANLLNRLRFRELSMPSNIPKDLRKARMILEERLKKIWEEEKKLKEEIEDLRRSFIGFRSEQDGRISRLRELQHKFLELRKALAIKHPEGVTREYLDEEEVVEIINEIYGRYNSIKLKIEEVSEKRRRLIETKNLLEILMRAGIRELPETGVLENLASVIGFIREGAVKDLESKFSGKHVAYKAQKIEEGIVFLHVICLKESLRDVKSILSSLNFEEIHGLEDLPKNIGETLEEIEKRLRELDDRMRILRSMLERLREEFRPKAGKILETLIFRIKMNEALLTTLRSETMRVIEGWVPLDRIKRVVETLRDLQEKFDGKLLYDLRDPAPDEKVPTVLSNPRIVKIFESLIKQYGWPGHREVDPTIISGILWVAMFGIMFPDYGHGLFIISLGVLLAYFFKRSILGMSSKKIGKLMIWLGISSVVFGLFMGEFFLIETKPLLPNLRSRWLENPAGVIWLIKIAVFFGIAQIFLALTISTWNKFRNREIIDAVLGDRGAAGILVFAGMVLTAFSFVGVTVIPGVLEFPKLGFKVVSSWPPYLMISGFLAIIIKPFAAREEASLGIGLVLETFSSFLANMFSYARIAGFAIVHAAFAMVVFRLMQANPLMGIGVGMILMNVFALTIEFMVCIIQALRLTFYEFMTKFYEGKGVPYTPWKL